MEFIDKGNDDYELVDGAFKLDLSRGFDILTGKPSWRFWGLRVNDETIITGGGMGKLLAQPDITHYLEGQYELSS